MISFPKNMLALILAVAVGCALSAPVQDPHDPYKPAPKPHYFSYSVKDPYTGTDFGQTEKSDGKTVQGSYSVQLPDGRKQTVHYEADHYNGFVAKVSYEGEAQYPPPSKYPPFTAPPHNGPPSHYEPEPHPPPPPFYH